MNAVLALAKRNSLCYFRDRGAVFFSLMAVLIVVMLYLLFLRNMLIDSYPDTPGMGNLVDAWVLSGILGIVPVTTSAGALQTLVTDRESGRVRDFLVTPMSPAAFAAGNIISTFVVGIVMSAVTLAICLVYLCATGCPLSVTGAAASAILLIPSALSASIIMYAICSFIRTSGAFSGLFVVVSVLIGFLCGIYMPMGTMPSAMQTIGTLVPASHMGAVFRNLLAGEAMDEAFLGAPAETVDAFRSDMGFDLFLGGFQFDAASSLLYVLGITAVFFAVAVAMVARKR